MAKKTTTKKAVKKVAVKKAVKKVAVKKVPTAKAAAPKKAAPAKKAAAPKKAAPAKKAPAKKVAPAKKAAAKPTTSIIARVDVGFGNTLYVRGEGAGLSWTKGTKLENTTPYEWALKSTKKGDVTFKFLINDELWAEGENITVAAGSESISSPTFVW